MRGWLKAVAGVEGIEPSVKVLETSGLPLTDTPTGKLNYCDTTKEIGVCQILIFRAAKPNIVS